MAIDREIRDQLERSLRGIEPPPSAVDPVLRRARSLRRRHRTMGALIAAVCTVALVVPLALLWPLGVQDDGSETEPATEPSRLVVSARIAVAPGLTDVVTGFGGVWVTGAEGVARVDPATNRGRRGPRPRNRRLRADRDRRGFGLGDRAGPAARRIEGQPGSHRSGHERGRGDDQHRRADPGARGRRRLGLGHRA